MLDVSTLQILFYITFKLIISLEKLNMWLNINHITVHSNTYILKGLAHTDLAKKWFLYCFMCDYHVALISALVLLKCGNLRITVLV